MAKKSRILVSRASLWIQQEIISYWMQNQNESCITSDEETHFQSKQKKKKKKL